MSSRVFRSHDLSGLPVADIHLKADPVGPQRTNRPMGGFSGVEGPTQTELPHQHMERRQRETETLIKTMLQDARRESETIQRDAYHAGFEQGERAGQKLALQKMEPTLTAIKEILEAAQTDRQRLIEQHEQELIKVAYAIATQVIKKSIEMDSEIVIEVIRKAMEKVSGKQSITVHVSPHDYQLLEKQLNQELSRLWPMDQFTLQPDESIGRGGTRIETGHGEIDATIESQLRALRENLWKD